MKTKIYNITSPARELEVLAPETSVYVSAITKKRLSQLYLLKKIAENYEKLFKKIHQCISTLLSFAIFCFTMSAQEIVSDISEYNSKKSINFPNAIHLTREDINGILVGLVGDNPNGIVSVLALKAGLSFRNTGDAGAETWFLVRNFGRDNSRMTLVLLDGRPLNLGNNHTVEFDDVPINIIESITIYPGPVPAQYGGFQSVIEIKTIRNEDVIFTAVNMGSNANYRFTSTIGKGGKFYYLANFDLDMADGRSYENLAGILKDFRYTNRQLRTFLPTFKVGYEFTDHFDVTLQGNFVDFKKMFHTFPMFGQEASRTRIMHNYSLRIQPTSRSALDYNFNIYQNREIETLNPIFPEDTTYNVHWGNQRRVFSGFRGYYRYSLPGVGIALKAGGEGHYVRGETDDDYIYFKYVNQQFFFGTFIEAELNLLQGSHISVGVRADRQNGIDKTFISPVGTISQSLLDNSLQLFAMYGQHRRWIPLNEVNTFNRPARIFAPPFLQGNVNLPALSLSMELLRAFQTGVSVALFENKLHTRLSYFHLTNEGQYGTPVFEIRPVNEGAQVPPEFQAAIVAADRNFPGFDLSAGFELDIEYRPVNYLSIFTNVTYFSRAETRKYDDIKLYQGPLGGPNAQAQINNSVGQFVLPYHGKSIIPGAYDWLANAGVIVRPDDKTIFNLLARYRGITRDPIMKFGVDPETDRIPANLTFDTSLGRDVLVRPSYSIRLIGTLNNIFNTAFQTFVHYPMQGTFYSVGITAEFK